MFASSDDQEAGVLVCVPGDEGSDEEYEVTIAAIVEADAIAAERGIPLVCVLVTSKDTPTVPPVWRQRMAAANNQLLSPSYHFALVTPSLLVRGVFTAVQWLTRPREGHHLAAFQTFEAAAKWVRDHTERTYPQLELLYARARSISGRHRAAQAG